jgi:hypothetical protein
MEQWSNGAVCQRLVQVAGMDARDANQPMPDAYVGLLVQN